MLGLGQGRVLHAWARRARWHSRTPRHAPAASRSRTAGRAAGALPWSARSRLSRRRWTPTSRCRRPHGSRGAGTNRTGDRALAHAEPIAAMPVDAVTTADVVAIVEGLLKAGKAPTARSVRQRIRAVFDWVVAQGIRSDNPGNGAIDAILPKSNHRTEHRASVEHGKVAEVLRMVRSNPRADVARDQGWRFQAHGIDRDPDRPRCLARGGARSISNRRRVDHPGDAHEERQASPRPLERPGAGGATERCVGARAYAGLVFSISDRASGLIDASRTAQGRQADRTRRHRSRIPRSVQVVVSRDWR